MSVNIVHTRRNMSFYQNLLNERNKKIINGAYSFFCEKLDISAEEQKMINITTTKRLANADGRCTGNYTRSSGELEDIDIDIKIYGIFGMIETLAHELVHAKQHLKKEFSFDYEEHTFLYFFKYNKRVFKFKGECEEDTPYFERRSEQEAIEISHKLMFDLFEHLKENNATLTDSNLIEIINGNKDNERES